MTIAVQTRYLQTSLNDCRRQRNPRSVGKCWLFRSPNEAIYEEANLGLQSDADLTMQDLLVSSSSEDSLGPHVTKFLDDSDQVSIDVQTKLKDTARRKKDAISSKEGSDDEDLRQLLLKQMNRSSKHSRSQTQVQPNKQKGKREKNAKCKENENGKDIKGKGLESIGNIPDQKKRFGGYSARP